MSRDSHHVVQHLGSDMFWHAQRRICVSHHVVSGTKGPRVRAAEREQRRCPACRGPAQRLPALIRSRPPARGAFDFSEFLTVAAMDG